MEQYIYSPILNPKLITTEVTIDRHYSSDHILLQPKDSFDAPPSLSVTHYQKLTTTKTTTTTTTRRTTTPHHHISSKVTPFCGLIPQQSLTIVVCFDVPLFWVCERLFRHSIRNIKNQAVYQKASRQGHFSCLGNRIRKQIYIVLQIKKISRKQKNI